MNEKYGLDQVSVRMIREAPLYSGEKIQNPQDAIRILGDAFKDYDRKVVGVVHLRSDNVPINMTIVSMGCLNQSIVHPREMLWLYGMQNDQVKNIAYICHLCYTDKTGSRMYKGGGIKR